LFLLSLIDLHGLVYLLEVSHFDLCRWITSGFPPVHIYMGVGHLLCGVPDGLFKGVRSPKNKYSGSLQ